MAVIMYATRSLWWSATVFSLRQVARTQRTGGRTTRPPLPERRGAAFGGLRSDSGEPVGEVEGVGREREGGAQAGHLVQGRTDQARPVVRGGGPGTEKHLGRGQPQVRRDVPAAARAGSQRSRMRPRGSWGVSAASQVMSRGPSARAEMRWRSALCTSDGMGRTATSCSARRGAGRERDEMEASVVVGKRSSPGEGVARPHREVVLGRRRRCTPCRRGRRLRLRRSGRRGSRG